VTPRHPVGELLGMADVMDRVAEGGAWHRGSEREAGELYNRGCLTSFDAGVEWLRHWTHVRYEGRGVGRAFLPVSGEFVANTT